jgi:hypothetical protein
VTEAPPDGEPKRSAVEFHTLLQIVDIDIDEQ